MHPSLRSDYRPKFIIDFSILMLMSTCSPLSHRLSRPFVLLIALVRSVNAYKQRPMLAQFNGRLGVRLITMTTAILAMSAM